MKQQTSNKTGLVWLVGAGPGAVDLLTVRAYQLIQLAEVVVFDRLVSPEILQLLPANCRRFDVGKSKGKHSCSQVEIGRLLVRLANEGKPVLRLKGGDPCIFGRLGEELDALAQAGIQYQVVPGISAASGCAAAAGIPLTERGIAQQLRFISATDQHSGTGQDWQALAQPGQTLVFYMGLSALREIGQQLQQHGLASDWPVLLIENGTRADQRCVPTDLAGAEQSARSENLQSPCLIIVGQVASRYVGSAVATAVETQVQLWQQEYAA